MGPSTTRTGEVRARLLARLQALFTRAYHGAAAYVLEAEPFGLEAGGDLVLLLQDVRDQDERHARSLARLIDKLDDVPQAGAFPYWYRDVNYLTLPYLAQFVAQVLETDLSDLEQAEALWPNDHPLDGRPVLHQLAEARRTALGALAPVAAKALEEEAETYAKEREAARASRAAFKARIEAAREAKQPPKAPARPAGRAAPKKAEGGPDAKERARQKILEMRAKQAGAATPSADLPDPNEEGISPKEKARRQILAMRAKKQAEAAPAAAKPAADELPDPNEEGISSKEKARRQILRMRAEKAAAGAPATQKPAGGASTPAADLPDPDEEGISPKEKARRQVLRMRAQKAASAPAAKPEAPAKPEALPDPDEPGISAKEKAKRQVLRMRAKKAAAAPAPQPDAATKAEALPDPDEPGISPKEKARRQVMRMRAKKAATEAPAGSAPKAPVEPEAEAAPSPEELPDPDEPGISPKEKARRQVMRMRAQKAASAAPKDDEASTEEPAKPEPEGAGSPEDLPDPDEPGISSKERARRQVMRMRAKRSN